MPAGRLTRKAIAAQPEWLAQVPERVGDRRLPEDARVLFTGCGTSFHAALACGGALDGVRLLSEQGVRRIFAEQSNGPDRVLGLPVRFGMGFGLAGPAWPIGRNANTAYWGGWGGSLAIIDLDARVSIAYVMNKMAPSLVGDVRGARIALACYEALAALGR